MIATAQTETDFRERVREALGEYYERSFDVGQGLVRNVFLKPSGRQRSLITLRRTNRQAIFLLLRACTSISADPSCPLGGQEAGSENQYWLAALHNTQEEYRRNAESIFAFFDFSLINCALCPWAFSTSPWALLNLSIPQVAWNLGPCFRIPLHSEQQKLSCRRDSGIFVL